MLVPVPSLSPEVVALLVRAHGPDADPRTVVRPYEDGLAEMLSWWEHGDVVAVVGYSATDQYTVRIREIATLETAKRRGLGRRLLAAAQARTGALRLEAETDDEAVGFYVACGFSVTALGEQYPGVMRYRVQRGRACPDSTA